MFRSICAIACLLLGTIADAHDGVSFGFQPLGGRPDVQTIVPGGNGSYAFRLTNPRANAGVAYVHAYFESRSEALTQYTFVSPSPACGAPDLEVNASGPLKLFFPVTLPASGTVECRYVVQRAAGSVDDLGFSVYGPCGPSGCVVRRGTLTDQALSVVQAPQPGDGVDRLTYRLVLRNRGARSGVSRDVVTECGEFGGGFFRPVPFMVENDFPGACPDGEAFVGCLIFTGANFNSYGFRLGPAPAGGESSCLVRLRYPEGHIEPGSVPLHFAGDWARFDGAVGSFDRESGNDTATLGFAPGNGAHAIPLPRSVLVWLGVAFVLSGLWLARRR
jgi:hypothetical protein